MAFSFFSSTAQDKDLTLLLDIGSASVGAALVKIEEGKAPHILSSVRKNISFQDALTSSRFLVAMSHALDQALKEITQTDSVGTSNKKSKTIAAPAHIFCTLSSPWFLLKSRHIHITKDAEFSVTEQVLSDFINQDIEKLKQELKETLPPDDVKIIEKKIIQMKLNGYEIKNPFGQKTSHMEISVTVAVSSGKVIQSIENKLRNVFHVKEVHFGAFPIAAFSAIRDIFPTEKNFLFIDITGESTDVSLVNNDLLMSTVSFPRGKNFFVREISAGLSTIHEEASSLFSMFIRGELDETRIAQVEAIVLKAEEEWLVRFNKAIASLSKTGAVTRKVFFTTDAEIASLFSKLISSGNQVVLLNIPFDTQYLDQLIVSKFVTFEAAVKRDPFLVVEALLAEKIVPQHK